MEVSGEFQAALREATGRLARRADGSGGRAAGLSAHAGSVGGDSSSSRLDGGAGRDHEELLLRARGERPTSVGSSGLSSSAGRRGTRSATVASFSRDGTAAAPPRRTVSAATRRLSRRRSSSLRSTAAPWAASSSSEHDVAAAASVPAERGRSASSWVRCRRAASAAACGGTASSASGRRRRSSSRRVDDDDRDDGTSTSALRTSSAVVILIQRLPHARTVGSGKKIVFNSTNSFLEREKESLDRSLQKLYLCAYPPVFAAGISL